MASLSNLSINRPVLAIVMSLIILLFGAIGISLLGIREFPSVDPPIINVRTNYVGANADVIEAQITEPLEEAINGIQGIKSLTSTSNDGASSITVEFDVGADLEAAANDVRDKVSGAQRNLPPDAEPPVVSKADADSQPIVFLNVKSDERSLLDLSDIAQNIFKERLQTIPGVSRVQIWGEKEYAIRLRMDPLKMASYGVTPLDVLSKVQSENVELPSGRI
jgi:multidrug efflux pump